VSRRTKDAARKQQGIQMTEPVAVRAAAKPDRSMNALLNYSIAGIVILAAAGILLGAWIW
jgi:hypothetical protein